MELTCLKQRIRDFPVPIIALIPAHVLDSISPEAVPPPSAYDG